MEIALIVLLVLINGIFAMSEMALVSSSKARLQKLADEKSSGAETALKLHDEPSRFLSTVQVGITSVGILNGAMGEGAFNEPIKAQLLKIPFLAPYSDAIALTLTVVIITYISVVIGELVPKRLALLIPEKIAVIAAKPMNALAMAASPLVWLLSSSSNALLWLMRANKPQQVMVTNDEIKILMDMGAEAGVFHINEGEIVSNVLNLDEQKIGAIMTPRNEVYTVDLNDDDNVIRQALIECHYSRIIVCRGGIENIVGVLLRSDLVHPLLKGEKLDVVSVMQATVYVPEKMTIPHLLDFFKSGHCDFALVVDEYGDFEGLVTHSDILKAIVGDLPDTRVQQEADVVKQKDGAWVVDGGLSISRLKSIVRLSESLPGEDIGAFNTLSGFILFFLEKVPKLDDCFVYENWHFQVVALEDVRIDKVLIRSQG